MSGQCAVIRIRRSGSTRFPAQTSESGAVPPVSETVVRDLILSTDLDNGPILAAVHLEPPGTTLTDP